MTGSRTCRLRRHARHPRVVQHLLRCEAFGGVHHDQVRDQVLCTLTDGCTRIGGEESDVCVSNRTPYTAHHTPYTVHSLSPSSSHLMVAHASPSGSSNDQLPSRACRMMSSSVASPITSNLKGKVLKIEVQCGSVTVLRCYGVTVLRCQVTAYTVTLFISQCTYESRYTLNSMNDSFDVRVVGGHHDEHDHTCSGVCRGCM